MSLRYRIYNLIEPRKENPISRAYDWLMLIAIAVGIFPLMFREHYRIFFFFDVFSGFCFVIDYILRWITADIRSGKQRAADFLIYPFTPMAIVDLLSILPTINLLNPTFKVMRVSRLLKLLRVVKVIRYYEPLEIIMAVVRKQKRILYTVLSLSIFYVFLTALIMFNAEEKRLFDDFFDAFYWAACTLTTVGYGDIYPISDVGRVISIISSMVGIAIIALPSGIITAGYMDELRNRKEKKSTN